MVGSPVILWQIPCSAQKKQQSCVPPVHLCVDLRLILSWSSAAHVVSSFNVMHGPAPSPQLLKIKQEEMGIKGPKQSARFPSSHYLRYLPPTLTCNLFICPCRTALPCSSVPTSWTRKTSSASQILSWSSTEVTRMERESVASLSFSWAAGVLRWKSAMFLWTRGRDPKVQLHLLLP